MPKASFAAIMTAWLNEMPADAVITYRDVIRLAMAAYEAA